MNNVTIMGRLAADPDIKWTNANPSLCVARYTLAVDRRFRRENEDTADFINCVAFGRNGEFVEKYFRQGMRVIISGHIQTGSYTDRDGVKRYTTEVVINQHFFCESRSGGAAESRGPGSVERRTQESAQTDNDGFMHIPEGVTDDELPFN